MITEKNNVFYCDCGFSFQSGRSGAHDCADGLRNKLAESEAKCAALAAENAGLKEALECVINPDNQPEYHDQGMGCGVEDRGYQRDGYSACYYGWESAMERVYSEVIPDSIPETPATDAFLAEVRASAVDEVCLKISNSIPNCYQDELVGLDMAAGICGDLASELRKGVQS